ncbi:MAG: DUF1638 domain-containing protein [Anaerolineae bacterium]
MKVLACATVIEELAHFLPEGVEYKTLEFGLHIHPERLRETLQAEIDRIDRFAQAETILLGYGLCGLGVVGLRSARNCLVIPRVDDCIAIFLGSREEHLRQTRQEPGTFYLTKGWIEAGSNPYTEYQRLAERYGEKRALEISKIALANYTRLALINTGNYEIERYRKFAEETARLFGLRYEEIPGSIALVRKMGQGLWNEGEFLLLPPGETVRFEMFMMEGGV